MIKKNMVKIIFLFALSWIMIVHSNAEDGDDLSDITGRVGIGYSYGLINEHNESAGKDLEQTHSLDLVTGLNRNLSFRLEGTYLSSFDVDKETDLKSIFADLQFRAPSGSIAPYLIVGLGGQSENIDKIFEFDDSASARYGAGAEYFFNRNVAVGAEGLFVSRIGDKAIDNWQAKASVRYYFGS